MKTRAAVHRALTLMLVGLGLVGCKEPAAEDPGYRAQVACNHSLQVRSSAGKGTRNDAKALCIGRVGDLYRADPKANVDALVGCILDAPDEAAAKACK